MGKSFAVVIATIRNVDFLRSWESHLSADTTIYIVEDRPEKSVLIPEIKQNVVHVCHKEIDSDLQKNAWIIPRGTSGIKSYGILQAWRNGHEWIGVLDDDCFPSPSSPHWEEDHKLILSSRAVVGEKIFNTVFGFFPRGFPFEAREKEAEIVLSVGGWEQYPDIDARTELEHGVPDIWWMSDAIVPQGHYFPLCGMNIAFKREIAPLMYFGLQGKSYAFDRYDDIWMGAFAKSVIDGMGRTVHVGRPLIRHSRASDPRENLKKETNGYPITENIFRDELFRPLLCRTWAEGMTRVSMRLNAYNEPMGYFDKLGDAMRRWAEIFIREGA